MTRADLLRGAAQGALADHRVRYLLAGGSIAVLYLGLFASLAALEPRWHYLAYFAIAQAVTISVAFPVYRTWVFESRGSLVTDLRRFLGVWSLSLVGSLLSLPLLVTVLGLDPVVAQVLAVVVLSFASYAGHRYVSFSHRGTASGSSGHGT